MPDKKTAVTIAGTVRLASGDVFLTGPLLHYSTTPTLEFHMPVKDQGMRKPRGLWVSVGTAWPDWCEAEQYGVRGDYPHVSEVTLTHGARVLVMGSAEQLDDFTRLYGSRDILESIKWAEVARDFQGIIIAPYVWERRLELNWYYGWDCASGCVWDGEAIASIKPREDS